VSLRRRGNAWLSTAARIRTEVDAHAFPRRRRLQVGLGVAAWPEGGDDAEGLLARARRDLEGA
jgi:hypothetical protein